MRKLEWNLNLELISNQKHVLLKIAVLINNVLLMTQDLLVGTLFLVFSSIKY